MTYKVKLELPVLNVWHIGDNKQEFDIEILFIGGSFLSSLVRFVALKILDIPLSQKKRKNKAYHLLKMLFN